MKRNTKNNKSKAGWRRKEGMPNRTMRIKSFYLLPFQETVKIAAEEKLPDLELNQTRLSEWFAHKKDGDVKSVHHKQSIWIDIRPSLFHVSRVLLYH